MLRLGKITLNILNTDIKNFQNLNKPKYKIILIKEGIYILYK